LWPQYTYSRDATTDSSHSHKRFKKDITPEMQIVRRMSVPLERYLNDNEDTTAGLLSAQTFNGADDSRSDFLSSQSPTCSDSSRIPSYSPVNHGSMESKQIEHDSDGGDLNELALRRPALELISLSQSQEARVQENFKRTIIKALNYPSITHLYNNIVKADPETLKWTLEESREGQL